MLMKVFSLARVAFAAILSVAFLAAAQEDVARHAVEIAPLEVGDTEAIDPKGVAMTSDGARLTLVFDAGQDVETYLRNNEAGSIAEVWIDTDLDAATGGKPFFSDIGGFEYAAVRVYVCKAFEGEGDHSGHICTGDVSGFEVTDFFSDYSPQLWDAAVEDFADAYELGWEGGRQDIEGQDVTVHIPYEEFEGTPGQTVRLLIMAGSVNGSTFPEVLLELK